MGNLPIVYHFSCSLQLEVLIHVICDRSHNLQIPILSKVMIKDIFKLRDLIFWPEKICTFNNIDIPWEMR